MKKIVLLSIFLSACLTYSIFGIYDVDITPEVYQGCYARQLSTWSLSNDDGNVSLYVGNIFNHDNSYIVGKLHDNSTIDGQLISDDGTYGKAFILIGNNNLQGTITVDSCNYYIKGSK